MATELADAQKLIRLTIEGDPDNTGTRKAIFEWSLGSEEQPLTLTEEMRTQTRAVPGGTLLTLFDEVVGDQLDGNLTNKDIMLNLGNGQFAPQISGVITADQQTPAGNPCQWGDTADDTQFEATDATGQHPLLKSQVLSYWLRNTRTSSAPNIFGIDGSGPAVLEYGEYRSAGTYSPLKVVFESPSVTFSGSNPSTATISIRFVEVADLGAPIDALADDGK